MINEKYETFEPWLKELEILADIESIDLHLNKYNYHTYFMRGYLPCGVIEDIKRLTGDISND